MFARSIRRALYQPSTPFSTLPPTFLLPLRARLTTITTTTTTDPEPPNASYNHHPTSQTPTNSTPGPDHVPSPLPTPQWPPHLSRHSPHPTPKTPVDLSLLPLLAAQTPHYLTAHLHSRPYLLTAGDTLRLPFHMPDAPPGTIIRLNRASMIGSRDYTFRGAPYVDEGLFVCRAIVVGIEGEPMRVIVKSKQRQKVVRRRKHKMRFTILRIKELRVFASEEEGREERERERVRRIEEKEEEEAIEERERLRGIEEEKKEEDKNKVMEEEEEEEDQEEEEEEEAVEKEEEQEEEKEEQEAEKEEQEAVEKDEEEVKKEIEIKDDAR